MTVLLVLVGHSKGARQAGRERGGQLGTGKQMWWWWWVITLVTGSGVSAYLCTTYLKIQTTDCYLVCCFSHNVSYSSSVCVCFLLYILDSNCCSTSSNFRNYVQPSCLQVSMSPACHKVSIKSMEYWSTCLHSSIPSNPFSKLSFMNFLFPRIYNKPTYTYSGFSFNELLAAVRQFLVEFEITPPN